MKKGPAGDRPNFLIFCVDQQKAAHLGCAGHPVLQTPNIDRIAAGGTRFESCYTSSPACMPARATMVTGLTNRANRVRTNGVSLPEDIPTLPGLLASAGYRTHAAGKLHLKTWGSLGDTADPDVETPEENPERLIHWVNGTITRSPDHYYGFQTQDSAIGHVHYVQGDYKVWLDQHHPGAYEGYNNDNPGPLSLDPELHYNHWIADRSIDFLRKRAADRSPFFLWCSFPDPHCPFAAVQPWFDFYRDKVFDLTHAAVEPIVGGGSETMRRMGSGARALDRAYLHACELQTYAMISHVDEQIGRVLDALEQAGLDDNTVVVFIADHGEQLGEHGFMHKGYFPSDSHARIPFVCTVPGTATPGHVVTDVVSLLDFVPTVLDLAGIAQPEDPNAAPSFFARSAPVPASLPGESLKATLLKGVPPRRQNALVEFDDENVEVFDLLQMRMLITNEFKLVYYSPTDELMLFDRRNDPEERNNLVFDPDFAGVREGLLVKLIHELSRTESRLPRRIEGA
ncbi:MAG: sulfatase-like hydrolase/transferase [Lentisphaerae bacterium]|nr:sulfatase-like hydrolase/transferase [Lentisphaerota bacterium]